MWEVGKNHDRIRSNMEYPQSYMGYMDMTLVHMQLHNVCVCVRVCHMCLCVCARLGVDHLQTGMRVQVSVLGHEQAWISQIHRSFQQEKNKMLLHFDPVPKTCFYSLHVCAIWQWVNGVVSHLGWKEVSTCNSRKSRQRQMHCIINSILSLRAWLPVPTKKNCQSLKKCVEHPPFLDANLVWFC